MSRGFLPLLAAMLLLGVGAVAWGTEGFRVVTSEGARRLAIERAPAPALDVGLVDQDGKSFSFGDYRERIVLVDFVYTRCPTVCGVLGDDFHGLLAAIGETESARRIDLLSISFDPDNDDREALKLYGERYGATAPRWRIAAPVGSGALAALLKAFGVVVIPDGLGGFVHNSAVYIVDGRGRLIRILDPATPSQLAAAALRAAAP